MSDIDDGSARPLSSTDVHRLLPGTSVDVLVRPATPGGPCRFIPLRLAVPSEEGYALHRMLLLRSSFGSWREIHCLDADDGSIRLSVPDGSEDAVALSSAFAHAVTASAVPPVGEAARGLPVRPSAGAGPEETALEAKLDVFPDMRVRVARSSVPGVGRAGTIGVLPGVVPEPCLFVRASDEATGTEAIALAVASECGGGDARSRAATDLVREAVRRGGGSFARLCLAVRDVGPDGP